MTLFRAIALVVLMAFLLFVYRVHPIAGWATLMLLFGGNVVVRRRKVSVAVRE